MHGSRCPMQDDLSLDLFAKLMILNFRKTPIAELFSYTKIFLLFVKLLWKERMLNRSPGW